MLTENGFLAFLEQVAEAIEDTVEELRKKREATIEACVRQIREAFDPSVEVSILIKGGLSPINGQRIYGIHSTVLPKDEAQQSAAAVYGVPPVNILVY